MKTFNILAGSLLALVLVCPCTGVVAQTKTILVDVGHGQKFYSDPADKISTDLVPTDRLTYMTGEFSKNAAANNATVGYVKSPITKEVLSKCDLLFIHAPGSKYSADEISAIKQYVENGGSLFVVMEEDYWSTLDQANVNDLVTPFGITFKSDSPDKSVGGHSVAGKITKKKYSIPSHGLRLVEGGKPFAYSNGSVDKNPFGVYTETKGGGKVVAMGEGMVSLYMTSWQDVNNYECAPFMQDVIGWLLK
jgi:hypothetical protein